MIRGVPHPPPGDAPHRPDRWPTIGILIPSCPDDDDDDVQTMRKRQEDGFSEDVILQDL